MMTQTSEKCRKDKMSESDWKALTLWVDHDGSMEAYVEAIDYGYRLSMKHNIWWLTVISVLVVANLFVILVVL